MAPNPNQPLLLDIEAGVARIHFNRPAYGRLKRLLRASHGSQLVEQLHAEHAAFCACAGSEDFSEGLRAFFGKRQAKFIGR